MHTPLFIPSLSTLFATAAIACGGNKPEQPTIAPADHGKRIETIATGPWSKPEDAELRARLSPLQYQVTQQDGTEPPFKGLPEPEIADMERVLDEIEILLPVLGFDVLRPAGLTPAHVTYLQLPEGIIEMVKAGMGATVLPKWSITNSLESGDIRAVRITKSGVFRKWYAVTLRDAPTTAFVEEFIRLLIAQAPASRRTMRRRPA